MRIRTLFIFIFLLGYTFLVYLAFREKKLESIGIKEDLQEYTVCGYIPGNKEIMIGDQIEEINK